jgi:hypothetical protein
METIELAGFILKKKKIEFLSETQIDFIMEKSMTGRWTGNTYEKKVCHDNAILAAKDFTTVDTDIRIIEGVVLYENAKYDGLLMEHFWNREITTIEKDFDITLDILECQKDLIKSYYEYKDYSLQEMEERKHKCKNTFSLEMEEIINAYYQKNPKMANIYYRSKKSQEEFIKNNNFNNNQK